MQAHDDGEHTCDFTCAACGIVKIIENANTTHKEGSDTKESQTNRKQNGNIIQRSAAKSKYANRL